MNRLALAVKPAHTMVYTGLALAAFAANSVLCRMALGHASIDAASFTLIRILSGAIALVLFAAALRGKGSFRLHGNWTSSFMLFLYAMTFSFAYISLNTGTGALILFGSVQLTMILVALWSGERPRPCEWIGLTLALAGLVWLVYPGLTAPSLQGSILMTVSGIAWGIYTFRGRGSANPLAETAGNFSRALFFAVLAGLIAVRHINATADGIMLAVISGAIASGLGYAIWYAALRGLTVTRAALVQLSVPVLAAGGGAIFLMENITLRLIVSTIMILGGIALAIAGHRYLPPNR